MIDVENILIDGMIDPHEALKALEEQAPEVLREWAWEQDFADAQPSGEKIHFLIIHPGELAAGINGFSDDVYIQCDSGDWGGDIGEFEEYIKDCLEEWYDGAQVISDKEANEWYQTSLVDGKVIAKTLKDFSEDLK